MVLFNHIIMELLLSWNFYAGKTAQEYTRFLYKNNKRKIKKNNNNKWYLLIEYLQENILLYMHVLLYKTKLFRRNNKKYVQV